MLDNKFEKLRSVKEMDQEHISMTINLILNLSRNYLTLCCKNRFLTDVFFSKSYKRFNYI